MLKKKIFYWNGTSLEISHEIIFLEKNMKQYKFIAQNSKSMAYLWVQSIIKLGTLVIRG